VTTILLDSHALVWWSSDSNRLSSAASRLISRSDELAVASITWYELAWLAQHGRISAPIPVRSWLEALADQVRTVTTTPAIAATAVSLSASFSGDPADRLIYATAIECGWQLVTKDERMRRHKHPRKITVW
jgi:PIN domain nuclease of toxin-antitoxin system